MRVFHFVESLVLSVLLCCPDQGLKTPHLHIERPTLPAVMFGLFLFV